MVVNYSLMGMRGVFRLFTTELCSHRRLITGMGLPSGSGILLREYAMEARPKLRKASTRIQEDQANIPIEEYLPPINLLKSAYKARVLMIEPETVQNVIRQYVKAWTSSRAGWEKRFIEEENIPPETLTTISLILNRSTDRPRRLLATHLLHTASALNDPTATVFILTPAVRSSSLHKPIYAAPLSRLSALATSPNPNPSALLLYGRIQQSQSNPSAALQSFRKAAALASALPDTGQQQSVIAEALIAEGTLLLARGDKPGAEAAFHRAAMECDSPYGYFYLAASEDLPRGTRAEYLLKAASSGVVDAPAKLAGLYLEETKSISAGEDLSSIGSEEVFRRGEGVSEANGEEATSMGLGTDDAERMGRAMGKEWLILAAEEGDTTSMRDLAGIFRREGEDGVAGEWERFAVEKDKEKVVHRSA